MRGFSVLFVACALMAVACSGASQGAGSTAGGRAASGEQPGASSAPRPTGDTEPGAAAPASDPARQSEIRRLAQALGAGINLGNALEAPKEGDWGVTLRPEDFTQVKAAGFSHVRIPTRWSAHAAEQAPYTLEPQFLARVDWAVDSALKAGLSVVLNVHHYEEMAQSPETHTPRLLAIWRQLSHHYQRYPDKLYFELLNEPHDALTGPKNNRLIGKLLGVVRQANPTRAVIVGAVQWNSARRLPELELPETDRNLIVTFHYYEPFDFTHQGAPWVNKTEQVGIDWPGEIGTAAQIERDFLGAANWAKQHDRPLYLGEFGAYHAAPLAARVRWTRAVVAAARKHGMPYAYWELRSGFGAYDLEAEAWRQPLLDALLGPAGGP